MVMASRVPPGALASTPRRRASRITLPSAAASLPTSGFPAPPSSALCGIAPMCCHLSICGGGAHPTAAAWEGGARAAIPHGNEGVRAAAHPQQCLPRRLKSTIRSDNVDADVVPRMPKPPQKPSRGVNWTVLIIHVYQIASFVVEG
jgi:hypothetical protein